MSAIGKVPEFSESAEEFESYLERFERWLSANDVSQEKKADILLATLPAKTYSLLKTLIAPAKATELSYERITETLSQHYKPQPIIIAERFRFYRRNHKMGESLADYILDLKRLSASCEFGTFLDQALRDKFVCGLHDEFYLHKLLNEADLTFKSACNIALAIELTRSDSQQFKEQNSSSFTDIPKITTESKPISQNSPQPPTVSVTGEQAFQTQRVKPCYRCGGLHQQLNCRYKSETCRNCGKLGHIARVCRSKPGRPRAQYVTNCDSQESDCTDLNTVNTTHGGDDGIHIKLEIDGHPVNMLLDTGASVSLISEFVYKNCLGGIALQNSLLHLTSYTGEKIPVLGEILAPVTYEGQSLTLPLVVVKGNRPTLLGRNWLKHLKLNWAKIFTIKQTEATFHKNLEQILSKHDSLFKEEFGSIKGLKATITVNSDAKPIFHKPRPLPYALKEPVEKELERMEHYGIVSRVKYSSWAAPIVVVPKKDKTIRLCGDYKVTVNRCIEPEPYPLPNVEDLFATLAGGKYFSKIDLSNAYQQLELDPDSKPFLTINTHKGLFQYQRLPFGVSTAPAIFQHAMDQILQGIDHVVCFLDDILITGSTVEKHLALLDKVLSKLKASGVRVKLSKCHFLQESVEYLGYRIDAQGLHPTETKLTAIVNAPSPSNVSELRSFLGLLNYYGRFLPNLSTLLQPLHELLQKDTKWAWSAECEKAFQDAKQRLTNSKWLAHYDHSKPLRLACDASPYGVGAVISHILPNGEEHPIAFASRTLTQTERNYAQIEREALSIIFGVKKFHKYLYGRKFSLVTDHKPLLAILGPKSAIPTLAALRMQRWALLLLAYDYDIVYRRSQDHGNADALSRLPCPYTTDVHDESVIFQVSFAEELPISCKDIAAATSRDPLIAKVWDFTSKGWPNYSSDKILKPYFEKRDELSIDQGCLLWGIRVVIPPKYRHRLLHELHEGHPGVNRMKARARGYLWWPGLDQDIEIFVSQCTACASVQNQPPTAPLHPWTWATSPWERIHIDYAEINQQTFLVVIDSYSKWLEVLPTKTSTSEKTITLLRNLFASYGLPKELVSDNGPQFTSQEFQYFLKQNGIRHKLTPPYHPASNGAAERAVQTFKKAWMKHSVASESARTTGELRLCRFLFNYRNTPHSVTESTPAELFLKRHLRSRLDLLKPSLADTMEKHQKQQVKAHNSSRQRIRNFYRGDKVLVRDFRHSGRLWSPGTICHRRGPLTYEVQIGNRHIHVHVEHLVPDKSVSPVPPSFSTIDFQVPVAPSQELPDANNPSNSTSATASEGERRYPIRARKAPDRLDL
uniref:Gypsy retrotransposon integrase-like protein 1 n=1 Tax=Xenopus tropicalis TaxID=8364 RepID=A0A803JEW5_XENTR